MSDPKDAKADSSAASVNASIATRSKVSRVDPQGKPYPFSDENCPGHASASTNRKVCIFCGIHVDELRPPEEDY